MLDKTIAAISTGRVKAGVALIRISGAETENILKKIFFTFNKDGSLCPCESFAHKTAVYGAIVKDKKPLDDVLLTFFKAPFSYTGEDVAEIGCHGGTLISSMVLEQVLMAGAVMAQPGEFTKRAYINGKISLTRAEGIGALLDAKTEAAAQLSSDAARGALSGRISAVADMLQKPLAGLYAYIDYPDEDLEDLPDSELLSLLDSVSGEIAKLKDSSKTGLAVVEGVQTLIVGKPNVGKSTLFNAMLGKQKAIVTDIAGTTRDMIEYPVSAGRILLRLADTAGIRSRGFDSIEEIGIAMVTERLKDSETELVIAVFDLSRPLDADDRRLIELLGESTAQIIAVGTKADLEERADASVIEESLPPIIRLSAKNGDGIKELCEKIEKLYISDQASLREGSVITTLRQKAQLESALSAIEEAKHALAASMRDACLILLEQALAALYETDGRGVSEKIVNDIFSHFCVGK